MKRNETNLEVLKTKELLWPSEVALILGVSVETVRRWTREGKLVAVKGPSAFRKYRRIDVETLAGR